MVSSPTPTRRRTRPGAPRLTARERLDQATEDTYGSLLAAALMLAFAVVGWKWGGLPGLLSTIAAVLIVLQLLRSGLGKLRHGDRAGWVSLLLGVGAPALVLGGVVLRGTFSTDAWIADAAWRPRQAMVADLLDDHELRGATRAEVLALLGPPDRDGPSAGLGELYWDFPGSTWVGGHGLHVDLDGAGHVASVREWRH